MVKCETTSGYMHPSYAESLAEFGTPLHLPISNGWILKRPISNTPYFDGMGCYPLFSCQNWSALSTDLASLSHELISLAVVTDPFGNYDFNQLKDSFKDVVFPFKDQFVIDLSFCPKEFVSSHHQRNVRKAKSNIHVEVCSNPIQYLDEWQELYNLLIKRHNIRGISAFSKRSFVYQLQVPGTYMFRAIYEGQTIGATLWFVNGKVGYYHLGSYNKLGYELRASFAIFWHAIEYFRKNSLEWLNLGGNAGTRKDLSNGLARFKEGWSTGIRTAFFCGLIFDQDKYKNILSRMKIANTNYFPAYRFGEFN